MHVHACACMWNMYMHMGHVYMHVCVQQVFSVWKQCKMVGVFTVLSYVVVCDTPEGILCVKVPLFCVNLILTCVCMGFTNMVLWTVQPQMLNQIKRNSPIPLTIS